MTLSLQNLIWTTACLSCIQQKALSLQEKKKAIQNALYTLLLLFTRTLFNFVQRPSLTPCTIFCLHGWKSVSWLLWCVTQLPNQQLYIHAPLAWVFDPKGLWNLTSKVKNIFHSLPNASSQHGRASCSIHHGRLFHQLALATLASCIVDSNDQFVYSQISSHTRTWSYRFRDNT